MHGWHGGSVTTCGASGDFHKEPPCGCQLPQRCHNVRLCTRWHGSMRMIGGGRLWAGIGDGSEYHGGGGLWTTMPLGFAWASQDPTLDPRDATPSHRRVPRTMLGTTIVAANTSLSKKDWSTVLAGSLALSCIMCDDFGDRSCSVMFSSRHW